MNPIQAAFAPQARGIDFIAAAAGLTAADLVALGVPDTFAARIVALYETYFGRTRYSRDQRTARAAAHSFAVLEVIERHARTVPSVKLRWQLRARLATLRLDARAMGRAAARVVRELKSPAPPAPGITRARHAGGMGTMKITADEALIADLFTLVDPQRPVESFAENIRGGTGGFRVLTHAVMSLDEAIAIERGQGPTRVRLTNGAVIDLREFLQRRLDGEGLVTVVSEREGLVDQYRLSRGANDKQRDMLKAIQCTCGKPGCRRPADECQVHHLIAWAQGGQTNINNLALLCAYHNGANDDDPNAPPRYGRIVRVGLRIGWQPPYGGPIIFDTS